jgi:hypothetical protein
MSILLPELSAACGLSKDILWLPGPFDLEFSGIHKVLVGNAKAVGYDLPDGAITRVAATIRRVVERGILSHFAPRFSCPQAIMATARVSCVCFLADGATGYDSAFRPLDDEFDRFHFLNCHRGS